MRLHRNVDWCMVGMSRKWNISANLMILNKKKTASISSSHISLLEFGTVLNNY